MNGAEALVATLSRSGVDTVFANPGTSEMHFVAALDTAPDLRGVLCLFEGVATGAADGYARMAERPAATLLHLGPGLANGIANLHDAKRARTPLLNVIGDHATYHKRYDAPLESDIDSLARAVSVWVRRSSRPADVGADAADAIAAAIELSGVASLILPGDSSWEEGGIPAATPAPRPRGPVADELVAEVAKALTSGDRSAVLLGGPALRRPALMAASRLGVLPDVKILTETFCPRIERGAGLPSFDRLGYFAELAGAQLEGVKHLVLAGATPPVAFFAYPGRPGSLVPEGCEVHTLAAPLDDVASALEALAEQLGARSAPASEDRGALPVVEPGPVTPQSMGAVIGACTPEGAVLVDEAITAGWALAAGTAAAPPHDLIGHTGGAIGQGLPLATGAAVACPDRRVISVEADGSALYTIQALWTQARESLDVTTVIVANRAYAILQIEMERLGTADPGPVARSLLNLGSPPIDFASVARGFGVPAVRAATTQELESALRQSIATPGPMLIEALFTIP